MEKLLIVGSGGFGRETLECVRAIDAVCPTWDLVGFLDDDPALVGQVVDGLPVVGDIDSALASDHRVVVTTGHPGNYTSRKRIVERLGLPSRRYATIIHPTAVLPTSARVGVGTILLATVVATTTVRIGSHVAVMPGTIFTHDDVVEDFTTFGAGVRVAGGARVREGAYVGSGAMIREGCSVGSWSLIGMGSVVTKDVPDSEVWIGAPARRLRRADTDGRLPTSGPRP